MEAELAQARQLLSRSVFKGVREFFETAEPEALLDEARAVGVDARPARTRVGNERALGSVSELAFVWQGILAARCSSGPIGLIRAPTVIPRALVDRISRQCTAKSGAAGPSLGGRRE
eukprot:1979728-Pyramimonas_sp.AAC.1